MKPNRSIPSATVIPVLVYPDVREAVRWLGEAFGFQERVRIGEAHRSQLRVGEGAVIVADVRKQQVPPRPGEITHRVMVRVDDVRAHCDSPHPPCDDGRTGDAGTVAGPGGALRP